MRYGTIVRYFPEKGFGFIRPDTGADIFFHVTAFGACQALPEIEPGQPVQFELMTREEERLLARDTGRNDDRQKSGKPTLRKAKLVELIDKIPGATLDEKAGKQPAERHPRARKKKPTWRR